MGRPFGEIQAGSALVRAARLAVAATVLALGWAMVHAMQVRATWYDEYYTFWVTRGAIGWGEALRAHWLADNHPPLFYALSRATAWLGETIEARRGLNLMIALAALGGGLAALRGRAPGERVLAALFLLVLAGQGAAYPFVAELRSYFLSFCAVALLALALVLVWTGEGAPGRTLRLVLWGATLVAFNTHVMTSVVAGAAMLPFFALALLRRDRLRLRAVLAPAMAAGLLFTATVAVQASLWLENTAQFWIPAGLGQAWGSLLIVADYALGANRLASLAGLAGLGLLALRAVPERALSPRIEAALLLAGGIVIAGGLALAVQAWRPSVIPKYLIGLIPLLAMIVALGLAEACERLRGLAGAALLLSICAMSLVSLWRNAGAIDGQKGWDAAARVIARQVARCPDTAVHVDPRWNRYLASLQPADNARVVAFAYRHVAARHGFAVEPPQSRRMPRHCPTLFWAQTVSEAMPAEDEVLAHERAQGFALQRLWFHRVDGAWIASTDPGSFAVKSAD